MKKTIKSLLIVTVLSLIATGCGKQSNSEEYSVNTYMNNDSYCVKVEKVYKEYTLEEPINLLENADYCFIGTLIDTNGSITYDDAKLKTELVIKIDEMIKGEDIDEITVLRDGGRMNVNEYLSIEGETYFDINMLVKLPDDYKKNNYIEIVPSAYFKEELNRQYLFFVKDNEIIEDAYGMLEVDGDKAKNIYTNEEYSINDLK